MYTPDFITLPFLSVSLLCAPSYHSMQVVQVFTTVQKPHCDFWLFSMTPPSKRSKVGR